MIPYAGGVEMSAAAWVRCRCEDYWCRIHQMHAHDCPCPPVDEWDQDPYTSGGPPMRFSIDPNKAWGAAV